MARRSMKASRVVTSCLIPMDVLIRVWVTAADRDALVGFSDSPSAALRSAANRGGYPATAGPSRSGCSSAIEFTSRLIAPM
jgi:hypothetical protein